MRNQKVAVERISVRFSRTKYRYWLNFSALQKNEKEKGKKKKKERRRKKEDSF
tara:strand:+ start:57 stop:215 length:159 start_codon:yes stop_codon:yes gene_type:complete